MSGRIVDHPSVLKAIRAAGLSPILEDLEAHLRSRGYAEATVLFYHQAAVHFAFWVGRRHLDRSQITSGHLRRFVAQHLDRCRCRLSGVRERQTVRAALGHLTTVLEARGCHVHREQTSAIDDETQRFDDYLRSACGLQETTRRGRQRYLREFLVRTFGQGEIVPSQLTPKRVLQYVCRRAARLAPGGAKRLASTLRSYFRFLQLQGRCDESLILAVPASPSWRLASLPRVMTDDEIARLLGGFDCATAIGRRDYAVTRCLVDLGLRSGEVARLRLDDIDWRNGSVRITGGKVRRDDQLPMTASLARAIAASLRRGRPATSEREVFLRLRPPVGQPINRHIVANIVSRAAARVGLTSGAVTPRVLRHTAATRLICHGASIKEVADILRHRCLDTTAIYTKVDLPRLARVAVPWPKGGR